MSFTHPINEHTPPPGVPESPLPLPAAPLGPDTLQSVRFLPLALIHPSPFNPRKTFDHGSLAELAESIRVNGLQQNLVVRPHPEKKEHFELMGGERRLRALQLLKAEGAVCKIEEASDGDSRARQLVENLQREDVGPMEEAAAFDQLNSSDPVRWSTVNIAAAVGKTQRFVQQRLGLVRNLAPELKAAMVDRDINIEATRVLAAVPQSLQKKVIERSWTLDTLSADDVREEIAKYAVPLAAAAFDLALYTGDYVEDGKRRMFGDVALFSKLQTAAAKKKLETLKKDWPDARLVKEGALDGWVWGDTGNSVKWNKGHKVSAKPKATWTALVYLDTDHKIRTAEGVKPRPKQSYASSYSSAPSYKETPERAASRAAFNGKLVAAIAKDADVAFRLVLLDIVRGNAEMPVSPKILKQALPTIAIPANSWNVSPDQAAKPWPKIAALKEAAVVKALAAIGAALFDDDNGQLWDAHEKDCPADLLAIGATLGVKPEEVKPTLSAVAAEKAVAAIKAAPKAGAKKKAAAKRTVKVAASRKKHP